MKYEAVKCPCGSQFCENWHVTTVANKQGVSFTKDQAEAVADLLNKMDREAEPAR